MLSKYLTNGTTALVLSLALVSGIAWAETLEIPFSGTETFTTVDPGVQFTDADGITHYRGLVKAVVVDGQDAEGIPITGIGESVININIDLETGYGDAQVTTWREWTYGDLTGSWRGLSDFTITGFFYEGPFNYPHGTGDFSGWHVRGSSSGIFGGTSVFGEGIIQIPGGDKAAANEGETWSGVKDLFR